MLVKFWLGQKKTWEFLIQKTDETLKFVPALKVDSIWQTIGSCNQLNYETVAWGTRGSAQLHKMSVFTENQYPMVQEEATSQISVLAEIPRERTTVTKSQIKNKYISPDMQSTGSIENPKKKVDKTRVAQSAPTINVDTSTITNGTEVRLQELAYEVLIVPAQRTKSALLLEVNWRTDTIYLFGWHKRCTKAYLHITHK